MSPTLTVIPSMQAITAAAAAIDRAHGGIEAVFLRLGTGLEGAMTTLAELAQKVAALPAIIDAAAMHRAERDLREVAAVLRAVKERLPQEQQGLADLSAANQTVVRHVQSLVDNIRTIAILARTSRIQAAALDQSGAGFTVFADEIVKLAVAAQEIVGRFRADQTRLTGVIDGAVEAHRSFVSGHAGRLDGLADVLCAAADDLEARRTEAIGLSSQVEQAAQGMSGSLGDAIMSLQVGDSTRQRLEHVVEGLHRIEAAARRGDDPRELGPALGLLAATEADQLAHALDTLSDDAAVVRQSMAGLGREAEGLMHTAQRLSAGRGDGSSFLTTLAERLARAQDLASACEAARQPVEGAVESVAATLGGLRAQMDDLEAVVGGITLVGINAAVRSARVGMEGRALAVIAQDLRLYADRIVAEAEGLVSDFEAVSQRTERLRAADGDDVRTQGLDQRLASVLDTVRDGRAALSAELGEVERMADRGRAALHRASQELAGIDAVETAGQEAHRLVAGFAARASTGPVGAAARALAQEIVGPDGYTMAAEREIAQRRLAG